MSQEQKFCVLRLPDELWNRLKPLLPKYKASPDGSRPRLPLRQVTDGIFYVLRTGCQWKVAPREFSSGSSLHNYFQEWNELGVFRKLWKQSLLEYDELKGIQWNWLSVDGAMTKSPLGGKKPGKTPPTGANWAPSGRCSAMVAELLWASK